MAKKVTGKLSHLPLLERLLALSHWQAITPERSAQLITVLASGAYHGPCTVLAQSDTSALVRLSGDYSVAFTRRLLTGRMTRWPTLACAGPVRAVNPLARIT